MKLATIALAFLFFATALSAQDRHSLAGAWEQTAAVVGSQSQQPEAPALHVIFSNGQYVQFRAAANRAKLAMPRDQMTREQLLERSDIQGQYGTYRTNAGKLTRRIISAADPANEGRELVSDFKIVGDTLTITVTNPQGQKIEGTFRRLR